MRKKYSRTSKKQLFLWSLHSSAKARIRDIGKNGPGIVPGEVAGPRGAMMVQDQGVWALGVTNSAGYSSVHAAWAAAASIYEVQHASNRKQQINGRRKACSQNIQKVLFFIEYGFMKGNFETQASKHTEESLKTLPYTV